MGEWEGLVQEIVEEVDECIKKQNDESVGYWDFWEKQSKIPGQDCETICSWGIPLAASYVVRLVKKL